MNYRLYGVVLALGLLTACSDKSAPLPQPQPKPTPTPTPTPPPTPQPPAYEGYQGYTLLFNQGLASVLTSQPSEVGVSPSLYLLDRKGEGLTTIFSEKGAEGAKDFEGKGEICEGTLSPAGDYLAYLAKYDFTGSKHASRLLLFEAKTLKIVKNLLIHQPGNGDEWVRHSFTLTDGSTYLSFDKRHYYRLDVATGEMKPLSGISGFASGGAAWEDHGYFFVRYGTTAFAFDKGSTVARQIPIALPGATIKDVYRAGGEWLILRDSSARYYLFSMKEGKVVARFTLTEQVGRSICYDARSARLYYSGSTSSQGGSDARERSVYTAKLTLPSQGANVEGVQATRYYTIAGRTEADNRQGYKMQIGLNPDLDELFVSYLDQGRSGPLLHDLTKVLVFQLFKEGNAPARKLRELDLHYAADVNAIFLNGRRP